jgi:hypothetical protein
MIKSLPQPQRTVLFSLFSLPIEFINRSQAIIEQTDAVSEYETNYFLRHPVDYLDFVGINDLQSFKVST